jgi:signal transduction histidine kinase
MAKRCYQKHKSDEALERQPTKEKLRHKTRNCKKRVKSIDRTKKLSNINREKKAIIELYRAKKFAKFYEHLKYLKDIQKNDPKLLAKSLCDISKEIDNLEIKLELLETAYSADEYDTVTLNSYGSALAQHKQFDRAFTLFDKSLEIDPNNTVTLNSYGSALAQHNQFDRAFTLFDKSLEIEPDNYITPFLYAMELEKVGKLDKAIKLLENIKLDNTIEEHYKYFLYLNLARLYYATKAKTLGDRCFNLLLDESVNRDKTLLQSAKEILRYNPYSKEAIERLKEIAKHSSEYNQAIKIMFHNMSVEEYFNQFNHLAEAEIEFKEVDEISKAIFHKIANQLFILKNRVSEYAHLDSEFADIKTKIEKISSKIDEEKSQMRRELAQIEKTDYKKLIAQISKASHDIADIVLNNLSKIKSDIDFILYDKKYRFFNELELVSNQLKINLSTMQSLKSINEPIKLNNRTFELKEIFKTFKNSLKDATIRLNIQNGSDKIYSDRDKIVEFLNELIENSIKYKTEERIEIDISSSTVESIEIEKTKHSGKFLFIEYRNSGAEIEKERKEKIFLPLYSSNRDGSGLGLFIIKKTLELMRGYIIEDGKGEVNFKIYIPYREN